MNLFITFYNGFSDLTLLIGLLGIFQLRWAYSTYLSYKLFIGLPFSKPDAEISQQYDTIWAGLSNPAPLLSPELLTIQFGRDRHWWNGILLPNDAAFAHKRQKVLMFVAKPELIVVAENPNAVNRDKFAIFAQIGKESLVGKIYRVGFQKYMTWKGISDPEAEVGKSLRRKRLARKMLRWIMILIILGFLLLLVLPLFVVARYG